MDSIDDLKKFLTKGYLQYRPNITVDCAIFSYLDGRLQLLISKHRFFTRWCLPGFYVRKDEDLDQAATRISAEQTGIPHLFLQQFKTFSAVGRNQSSAFDLAKALEVTGLKEDAVRWLSGETISVGYYAITEISKTSPKANLLFSECKWCPVDDLPRLGFDHDEMVREALFTLRLHVYHYPIGKNILPPKFTLREITRFYEVMSGKTLNASNFPNKLIAQGLIEKTDERRKSGAHRAPTYYMFNEKVYDKTLKEGLVLV